MKFSLSWLKQHLETTASADELAAKLTALGLEVEEIHDPAKDLAAFTIAEVVEAVQHPDADRLRVCRVMTSAGEMGVVCGAPNARAGIKVAFAAPGVTIPANGMVIKKAKIRGVDSAGMLCSASELGLSLGPDADKGIIELPADSPMGGSVASALGIDDPVFLVKLTPNRPDCTGVRGIARDLAAAGMGSLKPLDLSPVAASFASPIGVTLDFPPEAQQACPHFIGRLIRGVRNGESPAWLKRRLEQAGLRPISALVDITNYLTHDLGRPLHVFDVDKLSGTQITVRLARAGESMAALNGKTYELVEGMTVVADAAGPQALGGVIGAEGSGCQAQTTDVFLECAWFDPKRTARTGRALQIDSDARYRFERGVDPASVAWGAEVATRLILECCGGQASALVVAGASPKAPDALIYDPADCAAGSGVQIAPDEQHRLLEGLGFDVQPQAGGLFRVQPPSWRPDIDGSADVVEEVLRLHGFDAIPETFLPRQGLSAQGAVTPSWRRAERVRRALAARGLCEAVTWSMISRPAAMAVAGGQPVAEEMVLLNPITPDLAVMRGSILPGLIEGVSHNRMRGYPDTGLFEVGPVYDNPTLPGQKLVAGMVRSGSAVTRHWQAQSRQVDPFDVKADALAALQAAGCPTENLETEGLGAGPAYHPGQSGILKLGDRVLARFGAVHPRLLSAMDVSGSWVAAEVFLGLLPPAREGTARPALKVLPLQPVTRDFAFVVPDSVSAGALAKAARAADRRLIAGAEVFDIFTGPSLGEGMKSLAVAVTIQPIERTLTEQDMKELCARILAKVESDVGGRLRG
ncbi:MAG: phenylalanine--tRNA ligase subunit beta [Alphaproteobacteria bacterium]|nr:MAG: phenylalanine--tRNA ligase subunit beta [Alphaproteobacteria bacterium]